MSTTHGWYAWYNKMPGAGEGPLRVTLLVECPTSGYVVGFEPTNEGLVDIDRFIALKLVVTPPGPDDPVTRAFTTERAFTEIDEQDVELVRVDGVQTVDGRHSIYIPVENVY